MPAIQMNFGDASPADILAMRTEVVQLRLDQLQTPCGDMVRDFLLLTEPIHDPITYTFPVLRLNQLPGGPDDVTVSTDVTTLFSGRVAYGQPKTHRYDVIGVRYNLALDQSHILLPANSAVREHWTEINVTVPWNGKDEGLGITETTDSSGLFARFVRYIRSAFTGS